MIFGLAAPGAAETFGKANAVSDKSLGKMRGTYLSFLTLTQQSAYLAGNTNYGNSGNNSIAAGAIANNMGMVAVIQNSGNNVIVQNATTVSATFVNTGP